MTFSEANREFQIFHTSHKNHQIILAGHVSHFSFFQVCSQLQSDFKLF